MHESVSIQYLLDNFRDIWAAMCERDQGFENVISDISEDPLIKASLYLDGMSETQFLDRIRLGMVVLETSLGEEAVQWLLQYPPGSFILPTTFTVETAVSHSFMSHDIVFPTKVNVAGALCGELSPSNPNAILDAVLEGLCLDEHIGEFITRNIEIKVPEIH
tara:strand:+ start:2690 stop:3175 length:486 start_codon:yes stop_codon:yes gene_type:complete